MKKNIKAFVLFFLLIFTFHKSHPNKGETFIKTLSITNQALMLADQISLDIDKLSDLRKQNCPNFTLNFNIDCNDFIQKHLKDHAKYFQTNLQIYTPVIVDKLLNSSLEESESLVSVIIQLFIFVQYLNQLSQNSPEINLQQKTSATAIHATQKILEFGANNVLNNTIDQKPIRKRIIKTLLFTLLEGLRTYSFQELLNDELSKNFPGVIQSSITKFIECIAIESCSEIINKIFIHKEQKIKHNAFLEKLIPKMDFNQNN